MTKFVDLPPSLIQRHTLSFLEPREVRNLFSTSHGMLGRMRDAVECLNQQLSEEYAQTINKINSMPKTPFPIDSLRSFNSQFRGSQAQLLFDLNHAEIENISLLSHSRCLSCLDPFVLLPLYFLGEVLELFPAPWLRQNRNVVVSVEKLQVCVPVIECCVADSLSHHVNRLLQLPLTEFISPATRTRIYPLLVFISSPQVTLRMQRASVSLSAVVRFIAEVLEIQDSLFDRLEEGGLSVKEYLRVLSLADHLSMLSVQIKQYAEALRAPDSWFLSTSSIPSVMRRITSSLVGRLEPLYKDLHSSLSSDPSVFKHWEEAVKTLWSKVTQPLGFPSFINFNSTIDCRATSLLPASVLSPTSARLLYHFFGFLRQIGLVPSRYDVLSHRVASSSSDSLGPFPSFFTLFPSLTSSPPSISLNENPRRPPHPPPQPLAITSTSPLNLSVTMDTMSAPMSAEELLDLLNSVSLSSVVDALLASDARLVLPSLEAWFTPLLALYPTPAQECDEFGPFFSIFLPWASGLIKGNWEMRKDIMSAWNCNGRSRELKVYSQAIQHLSSLQRASPFSSSFPIAFLPAEQIEEFWPAWPVSLPSLCKGETLKLAD